MGGAGGAVSRRGLVSAGQKCIRLENANKGGHPLDLHGVEVVP